MPATVSRMHDLKPTPASIAAAKAAMEAERARITAETGVWFTADGRMIPPAQRIVAIHCLHAGCLVTVSGKSEAEAIAKLEQHLARAHGVTAPEQVA